MEQLDGLLFAILWTSSRTGVHYTERLWDTAAFENRILRGLYESYYTQPNAEDLETTHAKSELEFSEFERILEALEAKGLVRSDGTIYKYGYEITAHGILDVERRSTADEELVQGNIRARTLIIQRLAEGYEERGDDSDLHYSEIAREISIGEDTVLKNVLMLEEAGIVRRTAVGCCIISSRGLISYNDYKRRQQNAEEFERIKELGPQDRGRALEVLLTSILQSDGWDVERNVRSSNEEIDLVIEKEHRYYLVECKWLKDPVEAGVVERFCRRVHKRVGVSGIIVSATRFSAGAAKEAEDCLQSAVILLFGPGDLDTVVFEKLGFDRLLNEKTRLLLSKRTVHFS